MDTPAAKIESFFASGGLNYLTGQARNRMAGGRWTADDREDLVSWVAVQMWNKAASYRGDCAVETWAVTILENRLRSLYRSCVCEQRYAAVLLTTDQEEAESPIDKIAAKSEESAPAAAAELSLLTEDVTRAMERLPSNLRSAFDLIALQGLSYEEAAKKLDAPRGSVSVWLFRARKELQKALSAWEPQPVAP